MRTEKDNESSPAQEPRSEVARLRHQIALEYEAATRGLTGLAQGTAQHRFITAKMERIADHHQALAQLVGAQEATRIVNELALDMEHQPQEEGES